MFLKYFFILLTMFQLNLFALSLKQPLNACTFFSTNFVASSFLNPLSCSEFMTPRRVIPQGCQYSKFPPIRGTLTEFWFPFAFIEVTREIGGSIFAESLDAQIPLAHIKLATAWYQKALVSEAPIVLKPMAAAFAPTAVIPIFSNGTTQNNGNGRNLHSWNVRMLPIPYSNLATQGTGLGSFPPFGSMRGNITLAPGCYDGISEFNPGGWLWGKDDTLLATAYSPFAVTACLAGGGVAGELIGEASSQAKSAAIAQIGGNFEVPDANPSSLGIQCDRPRAPNEGLIRNFQPGSDALNPSKICMGTLGPLLPRSGKITGSNKYRTAEIAAIKFMSILGDSTGNFQFHLKDDDKFQLVYPNNTSPGCFKPGSVLELSRIISLELRNFFAKDVYVFAVWRKNTECLDPVTNFDYTAVQAKLKAHILSKKAFCSVDF